MSQNIQRLSAVLAWLCLFACSGQQQSSSALKQVCEPGTVFSCVRGTCSGSRVCLNDGSAMTPCECPADQAGASGDAATAGARAGASAGGAPAGGARASMSVSPPKPAAQNSAGRAASPKEDAGQPQDAAMAQDAAKPRDAGPASDPDLMDASTPPATSDRCDDTKRCVANAPDGWQGPVALRSAQEPPRCEGDFTASAFEAGDQPEAAAASCSACSCQGGCSPYVDFFTSDGPQCGGTSCTTSVNASCIEISPECLQKATTASLKTALPASAGCTPSAQQPSLPPARWKARVNACKPAEPKHEGCSDQQLCLPKAPSAPFEAAYCVWREGDQPCPAAPFSQRRVYHRELSDTRECSACACAAPSCSYSWRVYNPTDTMCATPLLQLASADLCAQINPVMGKLRVGSAITAGAACAASGGESRGGVAAAKPVTVCCER